MLRSVLSRPTRLAALLFAAAGVGLATPALAEMPLSQVRAANLARMQAERINGGLSRYVTATCMHQKGGGACMVKSNAKGYQFEFYGGPPGWEQYAQSPTVLTKILINSNGTKVLTVENNLLKEAGGKR